VLTIQVIVNTLCVWIRSEFAAAVDYSDGNVARPARCKDEVTGFAGCRRDALSHI